MLKCYFIDVNIRYIPIKFNIIDIKLIALIKIKIFIYRVHFILINTRENISYPSFKIT